MMDNECNYITLYYIIYYTIYNIIHYNIIQRHALVTFNTQYC